MAAFLLSVALLSLPVSFCQTPAPQQTPSTETAPTQTSTAAPQEPSLKEPLWKRLARFLGLTSTPSTQKGPGDDRATGDVWVVDLTQYTTVRLTRDGDYRSPIFLPGEQNILALRGDDIVQISVAGSATRKLFGAKGVTKLVGTNLDDQNKVLALSESGNQVSVKVLSLTDGEATAIPFDTELREDRRTIVHLQGWERVYGDTKVYVKNETKSGLAGPIEWTDIYLKQADQDPINVSRCDGRNCGQPSLSQNKKLVVYIKAAR